MSPAKLRAVYDANVLYDASVRDFCLWLAIEGAVEARWTDRIHQEWTAHLAANRPDIAPERIQRLRHTIDQVIPDSLVQVEDTAVMDRLVLPDPDDRHVVAAAVACSADVIVTFNIRDFPAAALAPYHLEALTPDEFVTRLLTLDPDTVCRAARHHRANLRRPAMTVETYVETLRARGLTATAQRLPDVCNAL